VIPRVLPPVHSPLTASVLGSGWRSLFTREASALESARQLLLQITGARDALLTDSGTSALALALRLAVGAHRDCPRVVLPAWGCYDLATAADTADVEVVLYDLDPRTLGPDWDSLDRALSAGAAAVVVVHAYGLPVDLSEVARRAAGSGTFIIEDAAQAVGATPADRPAGAMGTLGVLSFGRGKGWTGGGGGALLLNASRPVDLALPSGETLGPARRSMATLVRLTAQWLLARPGVYGIPSALPFLQLGQTIYRPPRPAARMSGTEASILLASARLQAAEADRRRTNARRLSAAVVESRAGDVPSGWRSGGTGYLRLPMLPSEKVRQRCSTEASRRLGIMPGYPIPLSRLPGFAGRIRGGGSYPGAEELARRLHTLPTHGLLTEGDLLRLEAWIRA
jgi:dTDP-4-amino-4,6-dideoxygalactose transaminase